MHLVVEIIGWTGAVLVLVAYVLLSNGYIDSRGGTYQVLNIFGAAGFVTNSAYYGALPSAVFNSIWMCIGLYMLVKLRLSNLNKES